MSLLRLAIIRRTTTDFDNFNQNMSEKVSIIRNILFSLLTKLVFLHYLVKQETGQPDSYIYASGYIETDKEHSDIFESQYMLANLLLLLILKFGKSAAAVTTKITSATTRRLLATVTLQVWIRDGHGSNLLDWTRPNTSFSEQTRPDPAQPRQACNS